MSHKKVCYEKRKCTMRTVFTVSEWLKLTFCPKYILSKTMTITYDKVWEGNELFTIHANAKL